MLILLGLTPVLVPADEIPEYPAVAPKYDYTWQVADDYAKVNYGQKETRDGATTAGSYFVLLPDGRTQKVAYTVDAYGGRKSFTASSALSVGKFQNHLRDVGKNITFNSNHFKDLYLGYPGPIFLREH